MKFLSGLELAARLKAQQAERARQLKTKGLQPKLAIVQTKDDPAINVYVGLKQKYGRDIGVAVDIHFIEQARAFDLISNLNADKSVHGIIVQLPLAEPNQTDSLINHVAPQKDVDGLSLNAQFQPATPLAILWLLAEHNINLEGKKILIVGRGKLVGDPLLKIMKDQQLDVEVVERELPNLKELTCAADVIITATGSHGVITADMLKAGCVVVDAGVAGEHGKTVGDVDESVYKLDDIIITPAKGGVGPLTVCALFENVLKAAGQF